MQELDINKVFKLAAADCREVLQCSTDIALIRPVRSLLASYGMKHKRNPDWQMFSEIMAQGYALMGLENDMQEQELSDALDISSPLIMRDYILGDARPSPERAAKICEIMADMLLVREADIFAKAMRLTAEHRKTTKASKGKTARPA